MILSSKRTLNAVPDDIPVSPVHPDPVIFDVLDSPVMLYILLALMLMVGGDYSSLWINCALPYSLAGMACQLYTTLVDLVIISHGQMMALDKRPHWYGRNCIGAC